MYVWMDGWMGGWTKSNDDEWRNGLYFYPADSVFVARRRDCFGLLTCALDGRYTPLDVQRVFFSFSFLFFFLSLSLSLFPLAVDCPCRFWVYHY